MGMGLTPLKLIGKRRKGGGVEPKGNPKPSLKENLWEGNNLSKNNYLFRDWKGGFK